MHPNASTLGSYQASARRSVRFFTMPRPVWPRRLQQPQQPPQHQQQRGRYEHAQQPGVAHYNMYPLRTAPSPARGVASVESLSRDITRRVLRGGAAHASRA